MDRKNVLEGRMHKIHNHTAAGNVSNVRKHFAGIAIGKQARKMAMDAENRAGRDSAAAD